MWNLLKAIGIVSLSVLVLIGITSSPYLYAVVAGLVFILVVWIVWGILEAF